jgi:hypothetical protein
LILGRRVRRIALRLRGIGRWGRVRLLRLLRRIPGLRLRWIPGLRKDADWHKRHQQDRQRHGDYAPPER